VKLLHLLFDVILLGYRNAYTEEFYISNPIYEPKTTVNAANKNNYCMYLKVILRPLMKKLQLHFFFCSHSIAFLSFPILCYLFLF